MSMGKGNSGDRNRSKKGPTPKRTGRSPGAWDAAAPSTGRLVSQGVGGVWSGDPALIGEPGMGWHNPCGPSTLLWVVDRPTGSEIAGVKAVKSMELAVVPHGPLVVLLARPESGWPTWQEMLWGNLHSTAATDNPAPDPSELTSPTLTSPMVLQLVDWRTLRIAALRMLSPEPHIARAIWAECGARQQAGPISDEEYLRAARDYQARYAHPEMALDKAVARGFTGARGLAMSSLRATDGTLPPETAGPR